MNTPIYKGIAQSDLDMAGFDLLNWSGGGGAGGSLTQHIFYPESYGAIGDGATDDTTALQACVNAAVAVNGTVKLSPVTYKITTALSVTGSIGIEGSGMFPQNGPIASIQSINMPLVSPYIKGSVILQAGAGQNGITISVTGLGVDLHDFGIRFADAIKFTNTGHGIFSEGAAYAGAKDSGIMSSIWSNIGVYGHDGNHYAFHCTNPICSTFEHLTGWGGGGIRLESNQVQTYYGNCVFENPYFATCVSGSAHGYHIKHTGASNGFFMLIFIRPQVNVAATGVATGPTNAQNTFKIDSFPVGQPAVNFNLFAPDFETDCGSTTSGLYGVVGINITSGLVDGIVHHESQWNSPLTVNNTVTASSVITAALKLPAVPVASLPGSPVIGQLGSVSDGAASLAWGATVTAGGSTKYLVWWNGANWIVVGPSAPVAGTGTGLAMFNAGPVFAAGSATVASWPKLTSGTVLGTPEAGALEYDGNNLYFTSSTTEGRATIEDHAIFRLASDGSAIGPGIADFFGTGSAYTTATNGVYEIIADVYFTKTTAGTVTFTLTNSQAYTNIVASYIQTPAGGISAVGNGGTAGIDATTTAAAAMPASPSLTTAVDHHFVIRARAECGTAGTIKLQVTSGAGTVTPRRGSFMKVRREVSGNVGAWQ